MEKEKRKMENVKIIHFPFFLFHDFMRLDLFLKVSRLIPRRTLAQEFCDAGLIKVNGLAAKSSKEIKQTDEIEIKRRDRLTTLKVLKIPVQKQVSRSDAVDLYEILSEKTTEENLF